jgi:AcrR family transcriptional regulator
MKHQLSQKKHVQNGTSDISEASPARARIMKTAEDLFYRYGIRTVGIDRIIAESDVAKMTFYKYFPSKSNLIAAYLENRENTWHHILEQATARDADAIDRILSIFDVVRSMCDTAEFQGCPFIKALAEFGWDQSETAIQECISSHFLQTNATIAKLVHEAGLPKDVSQAITSLVFGALVVAHVTKSAEVFTINRRTAELLLSEHSTRGSGFAAPDRLK